MKIKRMADLNRRFVVSSIIGLIVAFLIAFSSNSIVGLLLVICVAGIACLGVWEYAQLAIAKELQPATYLMVLIAACEVIAFSASIVFVDFPQLPVLILAAGIVAFFLSHFRKPSNALLNVAVEFFGVCYVAVPLSFMLGILFPVPHHGAMQEGRWWLVYLILVTKVTDVGAYFVGRLWGKRKMTPVLSPLKTVEGAAAGFLCAILLSLGMAYIGNRFSQGSFDLKISESVWLGMLLGIFSQIGDLAESLLKRDALVKDSNTLPGLGGVLDMVDSLLLTAPIVYFFIRMH